MNKQKLNDEHSIIDDAQPLKDNLPWFGLQLFGLRQNDLGDFLKQQGMEFFVPMRDVVFIDRQGRRKHELRPVVSNLMFIKMTIDGRQLQKTLDERYKGHFYIIRKVRGSTDYYLIPARQMHEFIIMCNPEILMKKYLSEEEAKLKKGDRVLVTHGPLKGITGRLVRASGKYYLLKEIPGMAVMMKVTRWCCQKAEE